MSHARLPTSAARRAVIALTSVFGALASGACSEEIISLAEIPGNGTQTSGERCALSADCKEGFFCDHKTCDDGAGTCQPFPVSCTDEEQPVCGCDGVTYFNDCLRRAYGVAGSRAGECGIAGLECDESPTQLCPEGAVCAHLSGFKPSSQCHGKGGRCWVLPATCPPPTHADRWNECDNGPSKCLSTCKAIRTNKWFSRASACE